ncbi:hypothetical protein NKH77_23080 [Streptomyces sp. M19]
MTFRDPSDFYTVVLRRVLPGGGNNSTGDGEYQHTRRTRPTRRSRRPRTTRRVRRARCRRRGPRRGRRCGSRAGPPST